MGEDREILRAYLQGRKRALGQEMAQVNRLLQQLDGTTSTQGKKPRPPKPPRPEPLVSG